MSAGLELPLAMRGGEKKGILGGVAGCGGGRRGVPLSSRAAGPLQAGLGPGRPPPLPGARSPPPCLSFASLPHPSCAEGGVGVPRRDTLGSLVWVAGALCPFPVGAAGSGARSLKEWYCAVFVRGNTVITDDAGATRLNLAWLNDPS